MTRQNNKSSQIKDTLLSPVLPLSVSLVSPPPFLGTCVAPTPLGWLEQVPLALTLSEVFLFAFGLVCVCLCVYSKSTSASTHPLLPHIPADTDGHCYHVQQMSQLIDKLLSRGIHFSLTSTAAACGWGLSQRFEQQSEPIFPPPPDLSLPPSLSLCSLTLSFSSLHIKSSCECQRSCGSAVAAAFLSLSLSHSSCSHRVPASTALTHHLLRSLSLSPSPPCYLSLPRFLVFHSTADLGEVIVGDKFLCLPFTQRKGLRVDLLAPGSLCIQASGSSLFYPYSLLLLFSLSPSSTIQSLWCMRGSVCVVDSVYIG